MCRTTADIVSKVAANTVPGERVIVMSNGSFDGIHQKLLDALRGRNG
jgi:UDP-N-acetylmuramate: L-alanyl-gamma-D-glutamyl-meso-diaminopimelate ligase